MHGACVWSLVRELRSRRPHGADQKKKNTSACNLTFEGRAFFPQNSVKLFSFWLGKKNLAANILSWLLGKNKWRRTTRNPSLLALGEGPGGSDLLLLPPRPCGQCCQRPCSPCAEDPASQTPCTLLCLFTLFLLFLYGLKNQMCFW